MVGTPLATRSPVPAPRRCEKWARWWRTVEAPAEADAAQEPHPRNTCARQAVAAVFSWAVDAAHEKATGRYEWAASRKYPQMVRGHVQSPRILGARWTTRQLHDASSRRGTCLAVVVNPEKTTIVLPQIMWRRWQKCMDDWMVRRRTPSAVSRSRVSGRDVLAMPMVVESSTSPAVAARYDGDVQPCRVSIKTCAGATAWGDGSQIVAPFACRARARPKRERRWGVAHMTQRAVADLQDTNRNEALGGTAVGNIDAFPQRMGCVAANPQHMRGVGHWVVMVVWLHSPCKTSRAWRPPAPSFTSLTCALLSLYGESGLATARATGCCWSALGVFTRRCRGRCRRGSRSCSAGRLCRHIYDSVFAQLRNVFHGALARLHPSKALFALRPWSTPTKHRHSSALFDVAEAWGVLFGSLALRFSTALRSRNVVRPTSRLQSRSSRTKMDEARSGHAGSPYGVDLSDSARRRCCAVRTAVTDCAL